MVNRLVLLTGICLSATAVGQEVPDLTGTWQYTVDGLPVHERCGQEQQVGELVIDRKITARAYRGKARSETTMEKCPGSVAVESTATIRVKDGNLVTIDYDEEGWRMVRVRFVDGAMSGDLGDGMSITWARAQDEGGDEGLTDEQVADLDEFLGTIEPELTAALNETFHDKYRKYLYKSGLSKADAIQVADLTVDRMTSCMLNMMRESVLVQEVPIDRLLANRNVAFIFDPNNVDARTEECIRDAERNAGIRIY